jgi:galactokinase
MTTMSDAVATGAADRVSSIFTKLYGSAPSGVWAAPGRANLIGEHTDYNDGFVLPFALDRVTAVAASLREATDATDEADATDENGQQRWTVYSEATGESVEFGPEELTPRGVSGWAAYVAGVVWSLREAGHRVPGARFAVASDVPVGSGLSSSAALECAVLGALIDLGGLDIPLAMRPALAQRAEAGYVGMPCGILDQSASVLCRPGDVLFLDCRSFEMRQIPFDLAAIGMTILVIDSKAPHGHVDGEYATRRASCESAAKALGLAALRDVEDLDEALGRLPDDTLRRRVRHIVTENARVLATVAALERGDVAAIGPLLTASHASMRDDYQITVPEIDTAVEVALGAGALGARMTGGGFGGCVLALVETAGQDAVAQAVTAAFAAKGFAAPVTFTTPPGPGARRVC